MTLRRIPALVLLAATTATTATTATAWQPRCVAAQTTVRRAAVQPAAPPGATGSARAGIDVLHYEFRVDFPSGPLPDTVAVQATIVAARVGRADSLVLDLVGAMRVERVSVNGTTTTAGRDSATLRVPLPVGGGDTIRVAVAYRGHPNDGLIIARDSAGYWTAFADHFPDRARQWLPTVDHPADKATVEWVVRAPATHRVIANGELQEETPELPVAGGGAFTLTRWRTMRPVYTAVMVIGVAPFATFELGNTACNLAELPGCVRQSVWTTPDVRSYMPGPFARAGEIVAFFSRLAGPFPYEKLAHVQSTTRYGGMENASAIFYADDIYRKRSMSEGLIAHESAHQWFGDAVTESEWPHVWLSEGFATYFAALWTEHSRGDSAFRDDLREMRRSVLDAKVTVEKPVIDESLRDLRYVLNSNVYQKAGFVLHMLRRQVGDSAFFRGVRSYYLAHRHGNALTADFVQAQEKASGQRLDWFFDQWMRRPGFAELTTGWRWNAAKRALFLTVSQNDARFAPYRLNLSVDVTDAGGRVHRARVTLPAAREATVRVPIQLDGAPREVVFDPDVTLLGKIVVP